LWVAVVQRPVAMNEAPLRLLGDGVARQRPVVTDQQLSETLELFAQALFCVFVVVQVDFNFAQAHSAQIHQRIEVLWTVLFFGVKEGMHRGTAVGVFVASTQGWVLLAPTSHTSTFGLVAGRLPLGLVV